MKIHRLTQDTTNRFIKINGLKEVTNLNALDKGVPASGSLFDYDIFGFSVSERKNIPAYINLKGYYLHPLVYNTLKNINRNIESLILGIKNYKISDDGKLIEDTNGDSGLKFLYDNWDKIKFKETKSILGGERLKNIKDRDSAFIDKIIVLPAYYRDINTTENNRISSDEINQRYIKILRLVNNITSQEQYGFMVNVSKGRLQLILNELHDSIILPQLKAKYSVFHRYVMGKSIDFGARLVISTSQIENVEKPSDMQVKFNQIGLPLSTCCSIFFPFIVYGIREFFRNEFIHGGKYPYYTDNEGNTKYTTLIKPEAYYSDEFIINMIKNFIFGPTTRFTTIDIPPNEDNIKGKIQLTGFFGKDKTSIKRDMTWTDLLFIIATDILANRYVYATRYPIEDYYGINPSGIAIMTTTNTHPALIGNKSYKFYPVVKPNESSEALFIDTLVLPSGYLMGYGADFDGDQMSVIGVWTNEANEDAEAYTKDKKNLINLINETNRMTQKDFVQTFYAMTKKPVGDGIPIFQNLSRIAEFK